MTEDGMSPAQVAVAPTRPGSAGLDGRRFSIVIPTRNRPHLLPYAVRSALLQTGDLEVVVSDNGTGKETRAVVDAISDSRLRYVRTPRPLAMPDSWEFALSQANGDFITFLCDDDALLPGAVAQMRDALAQDHEVVTWAAGSYYHDNWFEIERRNTVDLPHVSGVLQIKDAKVALRRWYDELWPGIPSPKLLNSCASRRVLQNAAARPGRLFLDPCPDVSAAVLQLAVIDRYAHLDRVLMLSGSARESNGAAQWFNQREVVASFAAEFDTELFQQVPLVALVTINFVAETLMRVKSSGGDLFASLDINIPLYLMYCREALVRSAANGADVEREMNQWEEYVRSRPIGIRKAVDRLQHSQGGSVWKVYARRIEKRSRMVRRLKQRVRPTGPARSLTGDGAGFANILECAAFLSNEGTSAHRAG